MPVSRPQQRTHTREVMTSRRGKKGAAPGTSDAIETAWVARTRGGVTRFVRSKAMGQGKLQAFLERTKRVTPPPVRAIHAASMASKRGRLLRMRRSLIVKKRRTCLLSGAETTGREASAA